MKFGRKNLFALVCLLGILLTGGLAVKFAYGEHERNQCEGIARKVNDSKILNIYSVTTRWDISPLVLSESDSRKWQARLAKLEPVLDGKHEILAQNRGTVAIIEAMTPDQTTLEIHLREARGTARAAPLSPDHFPGVFLVRLEDRSVLLR